jgi:membrane protease YdiL (CAAX protease family)
MKAIKENLVILVLMTGINLFVLWNFISEGQTMHGIGYFIFFYMAVSIIHFFTHRISPKVEIEVKEPKKELIVAVLFSMAGLGFLALNFLMKANVLPSSPFVKIPVLLGNLFFSMPLGILVYLLLKKYKILELGLRTRPLVYLLTGLIIWGLTGLFAFVFNRSGILWESAYEEIGAIGLIMQGIIGAALVEEFSRFVIQSRFEKIYKTLGVNILFATIIWAFMHFPVSYYNSKNASGTIIYCIQIIPIGFVWGYLTQRTKSILPSVFVHGLNLWGFQNGN